jgi:hypothetical protein
MTNQTWIQPPPPQKGMGCFAKGCLILIAFCVLLGIAFVGGTYLAMRYLRAEYFPTTREALPTPAPSQETQETARARWDAFERAAHAREPARIELTADDMNALIASDGKLRGKAHVSIENNVGHLQVSVPLDELRWLRGHYLNAECTVQSAADGNPAEARITGVIVNGRPVSDDVLRWQYRSWSLRGYISDWSNDINLERFEIGNGKVVLQTKGSR